MTKKLSAYNRYMRQALKGKMKGKTKAQRKAIFKAAAKGWKRKKPFKKMKRIDTGIGARSKVRSNPRSKPRHKRKVNPVGKRRGFLSTQTFMKFARLFALAAPAAAVAMGPGTPEGKVKEGVRRYTGFNMNDGSFSIHSLGEGWLPFLATSLATVGISKINGIIRRL